MNICHRSIWNSALGAWVAVSEATRGRGKTSGGGSPVLTGAALVLIGVVPSMSHAADWIQAGTGAWTDSANWDEGEIPDANTPTILNNGTAQISTGVTIGLLIGGTNGAIDLTLNTSQLTTGSDGQSSHFGGVIKGDGGLVKKGDGTLTLGGASTYKGVTFIEGGTVMAGAANSLSARSMFVLLDTVGATLDLNNFNQTIGSLQGGGANGGNVNLGTATLTTGGDNNSTTYIGSISGTGGVIKTGSGTMSLYGTNSYTGGTTVSGGRLEGYATGIQGNITNNAVVLLDQDVDGTYAFDMSGSGTLVVNGNSALTLRGANTYSGGTDIRSGTLKAGAVNAFSAMSKFQLFSGANLDLNGFNQTIGSLQGAGTVSLGARTLTTGGDNTESVYSGSIIGTGGLVKTGSGTMSLYGTNSYTGGTTVSGGRLEGSATSIQGNIINNAVVQFYEAAAGTFAGDMSGTGTVKKLGSGALTMTGSNSYSGITNVYEGILSAGVKNALSANGRIELDNTAGVSLDLNGFDQTIGSLYGGGANGGNVKLGAGILTIGVDNSTSSYSGRISGTGGFIKTGSGYMTLGGNNNYTGGTTVNGGVLAGNSTSLQGNIQNNAKVTFSQAVTGTYAGNISGTGVVDFSITDKLILSGVNSYSGVSTIWGGIVQAGVENALSANSALNLYDGFRVTLDLNNFNQTIGSLAGGGAVAGNVNLGTATLTTGGDNTSTTYSGSITGTGGLIKAGSGTMTLAGANNTYKGGTTVNGGTLAAGANNAFSAGSALTVSNGATLDLNNFYQTVGSLAGDAFVTLSANLIAGGNNTSTIFSGDMSGSGGLTKEGTGTLTLTGTNTYTNGTMVNGGVLKGNTTSLTGNIGGGNSSNVTFDQSVAGTYTGIMLGDLSLTKTNSGTLKLTGANIYTGGTTVSAGVLQGDSTSLQGSIANNANVNFDQAATGTFGGVMSGTGSLSKTNSGNLTLSGANTYSGTTSVNGGILTVDGSNANSAVAVNTGGILSGSGTVSNTTVASGGTLKGSAGQVLTTGSLVLNNGANVDVTLGSASNTGLFQVNGDITLGGNLNVTDMGGFGAGVYRIFNYSGNITNNGLNIGSVPVGSDLSVQTAVDKQVNLINKAGMILSFWDGDAAGNAGNGAINGGSGTWTASSSNWADEKGVANGPMAPAPGFAVFQGTAGSVTADNSLGALGVTGMQFASDGYVVQGDSITLSGTTGIIRVGDGSGSKYTATVSSALTGTAGLEKTDVGTLVLAGANTYAGGTTVSGGVLQIGNGGTTGSIQGDVVNNGALAFNRSDSTSFGGVVSGTGSLTQNGPGTLILSGANTYTGGTTVTGGVLQGNSTSLQGNIVNNATVAFDQAAGGTYAGEMSGTGTLKKNGTGTLILSGNNTYTGGTTISGGNLQGNSGSLQGNITNNAIVTFDQAANGTYAGDISGTGTLDKIGGGNLTLSGTNTYTGATSVNGGILTVNGSIANSSVTVNSGGTLGGTGTIGSLDVQTGGALAQGNSAGNLKVNGNVNFAAGSTFRVVADAAGNNDRFNVTGIATLNGSQVDVQAGAGNYAASTTFTVLNATGGINGKFGGVTSNLAFLTPTLGYDANNVFLTLARNGTSFNDSTIVHTPNQGSTSGALQNAAAGATGDMSTVLGALTGLSAEQARAAYDSVGGSSLVSLRNAGASIVSGFGNQIQGRLGAVQSGGASKVANSFTNRPVMLAANDHVSDLMLPATVSDSPEKYSLAGGSSSSLLPSKNDAASGFWLRANSGRQDTASDNNAAASKVRSSGFTAGFDAEVGEGLRAGVALSGGNSTLSMDSQTSGKSRGGALALYGSYASGPWTLSGSTSLAHGTNHMERNVNVGAINRVASSDFDSTTISVYGEATYSLAEVGGWTIQPLAGVSLSHRKDKGFTETGAGALNLQVAGQTNTSTKSLLGAKGVFDSGSIRLEPRVIWAHEFGDVNKPMTSQFQGAANASPFQVSGVALKRDTLVLGLGASGTISKNIELFADVQAEHNSRQNNVAVLVGLRARW